MIYKKMHLKEIDSRFAGENAYFYAYIAENNGVSDIRPALLIAPGGGYQNCSLRESEPIAFRFLSEGFNCFVLEYSVKTKYPLPHLELAACINYIRNHESEFNLIPNSLSLVGFSASGHLVGSYGYLYKELAKDLKVEPSLIRPVSIVMAYPVTSSLPCFAHSQSIQTISGGDESLIKKLDIPSNVSKDYPPTFVWTTFDDQAVSYKNAVLLEEALIKMGVKHKTIYYKSCRHGASLANRSVYIKSDITPGMKTIRNWPNKAADFIFKIIDK